MSNIQTPSMTDNILNVLVNGDLSRLTNEEKLSYYNRLCESLGVNPLTKPFQFIKFQGKEVLYATRDCADQLRKLYKVSIKITAREIINGAYIVTAQASLADGRCDESTGVVSIDGLRGDALANSYLKAETKAKRRVTLSLCGLGLLDETEVETIKDAKIVQFPVEKASETIKMSVQTIEEFAKENGLELHKSLAKDAQALGGSLDAKSGLGFRVPEKFEKSQKINPADYIAKCGKVGGLILGNSLSQIGKDEVNKFLDWLSGNDPLTKPSRDYVANPDVQEFMFYANEYLNDQDSQSR